MLVIFLHPSFPLSTRHWPSASWVECHETKRATANNRTFVDGKTRARMPVTIRIIIFFVGDPYKPSFATVTGRRDNPMKNSCSLLKPLTLKVSLSHKKKKIERSVCYFFCATLFVKKTPVALSFILKTITRWCFQPIKNISQNYHFPNRKQRCANREIFCCFFAEQASLANTRVYNYKNEIKMALHCLSTSGVSGTKKMHILRTEFALISILPRKGKRIARFREEVYS